LLAGTGRKRTIVRVKTGGDEFQYLMKNATVYNVEADPENPNYSLLHTLLLDLELNRFKKLFVHRQRAQG
jgi:hypothetical protein